MSDSQSQPPRKSLWLSVSSRPPASQTPKRTLVPPSADETQAAELVQLPRTAQTALEALSAFVFVSPSAKAETARATTSTAAAATPVATSTAAEPFSPTVEPALPVPDALLPRLDLVIVGINPGLTSAEKSYPYAGPTNAFWPLISETGLLPPACRRERHLRAPHVANVGVCNLVDRPSAGSDDLERQERRDGAAKLKGKLCAVLPRIIAFNGKEIFDALCVNTRASDRQQKQVKSASSNSTNSKNTPALSDKETVVGCACDCHNGCHNYSRVATSTAAATAHSQPSHAAFDMRVAEKWEQEAAAVVDSTTATTTQAATYAATAAAAVASASSASAYAASADAAVTGATSNSDASTAQAIAYAEAALAQCLLWALRHKPCPKHAQTRGGETKSGGLAFGEAPLCWAAAALGSCPVLLRQIITPAPLQQRQLQQQQQQPQQLQQQQQQQDVLAALGASPNENDSVDNSCVSAIAVRPQTWCRTHSQQHNQLRQLLASAISNSDRVNNSNRCDTSTRNNDQTRNTVDGIGAHEQGCECGHSASNFEHTSFTSLFSHWSQLIRSHYHSTDNNNANSSASASFVPRPLLRVFVLASTSARAAGISKQSKLALFQAVATALAETRVETHVSTQADANVVDADDETEAEVQADDETEEL